MKSQPALWNARELGDFQMPYPWPQEKIHGVHSSKTSYFVCGTSVILGHNSYAHLFLDTQYNTLILSVLSNLPKGQVELDKEKRRLTCPLDKCITIFFSCPVAIKRLLYWTGCYSVSNGHASFQLGQFLLSLLPWLLFQSGQEYQRGQQITAQPF